MGYNRGSRSITIEAKGAEMTPEFLANATIEALRRDGSKTAHLKSVTKEAEEGLLKIEWYASNPATFPGKPENHGCLTSYLRPRKGFAGVYVLRSGTMPWSTEQTVFTVR